MSEEYLKFVKESNELIQQFEDVAKNKGYKVISCMQAYDKSEFKFQITFVKKLQKTLED